MPSTSTTIATLALLPITLSAVYLFYLERRIARATALSTGRRSHRPSSRDKEIPPKPFSLPEDVASDETKWTLAFERVVSHAVPATELAHPLSSSASIKDRESPSPLLRAYAYAVQSAFSWTPQALAIRASIREPAVRRTFDAAWLQDLAFARGDLVNGVYKVVYHGGGHAVRSERVELVIEAPPSWSGPEVRGIIVAEVRGDEADADADFSGPVVFVNETWMWRHGGEKPTMLETAVGRWFHGLLAGWLVLKGVGAVKQ
ncbi:hypothetical protein ACHAQA_008481 [Verticillium albo-atrum]